MTHAKQRCAALTAWLLLWPAAFAQPATERAGKYPYDCVETTAKRSLGQIRREIREILAAEREADAAALCRAAELMKRAGDARAERYYAKAIAAAPSEPAYELFYADYLRNFRGAQRPLFARAEKHYFAALDKLTRARDRQGWDEQTRRRVERGLTALYQEDGLPLLTRGPDGAARRPLLFLSTTGRVGRLTTDFEAVDDVRALTAEALFTASAQRLNRPLLDDELRSFVRPKQQFETYNRVRVRAGHWPAFELFYRHRKIGDAQVTNFFAPGRFNDFQLNEAGAAAEKSFSAGRGFDVFLRGSYRRVFRKGLIEFLPHLREDVDQFEARGAVARFFGPDKVVFETVYVFQDINPQLPNPPRRRRRIAAATLTYQIFRPLPFLQSVYGQRFETRGLHLTGGVAADRETFGAVDVDRRDFFFGAALRGLGRFDLSVQPSLFTARVGGDASQTHRQYRTNLNLLYRIKDEEEQPLVPERASGASLAFLHLVFPFRHDVALRGPDAFANVSFGLGLDAKFFTLGPRRTTFLTSFRYNRHRFHNLGRSLNLYSLHAGMGF